MDKTMKKHLKFIPLSQHSISNSKDKKRKKKKLKHVFVFYIFIGNLDDSDVPQYISAIADKISLTKKYKGVQCLFLPTRKDYGRKSIIKLL